MLKNLQNPGRMTGNIEGTGGEDSKWIDTNTFFICFPGNP